MEKEQHIYWIPDCRKCMFWSALATTPGWAATKEAIKCTIYHQESKNKLPLDLLNLKKSFTNNLRSITLKIVASIFVMSGPLVGAEHWKI